LDERRGAKNASTNSTTQTTTITAIVMWRYYPLKAAGQLSRICCDGPTNIPNSWATNV
jgi:hypothetical protein